MARQRIDATEGSRALRSVTSTESSTIIVRALALSARMPRRPCCPESRRCTPGRLGDTGLLECFEAAPATSRWRNPSHDDAVALSGCIHHIRRSSSRAHCVDSAVPTAHARCCDRPHISRKKQEGMTGSEGSCWVRDFITPISLSRVARGRAPGRRKRPAIAPDSSTAA